MSQFVVTIAELYILLHKLEPGHRLFLSFVRIVVNINRKYRLIKCKHV